MKASHVLTLTAAAAALALALAAYAVSGNAVRGFSPSPDRPGPAYSDEGTTPDDSTAWRQAVAPLVAELAALKQTQARMSAMQGDLGRLKSELADLRRRLEEAEGADGPRFDAFGAEGDLDPLPQTEADLLADAREQQERDRVGMEVVDEIFRAEQTDRPWASDTGQLVTDALDILEATQTDLPILECRSTMCRVETRHPDIAAANDFAARFPMEIATTLPEITFHYEPTDDGSVQVMMYLAKEGHAVTVE